MILDRWNMMEIREVDLVGLEAVELIPMISLGCSLEVVGWGEWVEWEVLEVWEVWEVVVRSIPSGLDEPIY